MTCVEPINKHFEPKQPDSPVINYSFSIGYIFLYPQYLGGKFDIQALSEKLFMRRR